MMKEAVEMPVRLVAQRNLVLLSAIVISSQVAFAPAQAEPERFGDWTVEKISDEMDPTSHVRIMTVMKAEGDSAPTEYDFGFDIFGGHIMSFSLDYALPGEKYWPGCDFDLSSYKIGKSAVKYFPREESGGDCDSIIPTRQFVTEWMAASTAKLKLYRTVGTISL